MIFENMVISRTGSHAENITLKTISGFGLLDLSADPVCE